MVALKEFSAAGVAIVDEKVVCDEAVSVGGVTYYRGYLNYTVNPSVADNAAYGLWTAVEQGGTKQTVLLAGYPAAVGQAAIRTGEGQVFTTAPAVLYARYLAHEPIKHGVTNYTVHVPYTLTTGQALTLDARKFPVFAKFGAASVHIWGQAASVLASITLSNGSETVTVALQTAATPTYTAELTTPLKVTTSQTLTIATTDGKDAHGLTLTLWDV